MKNTEFTISVNSGEEGRRIVLENVTQETSVSIV